MEYDPIYMGLWGYNGVLSSAAIGGFFFVPNVHSILTALLNVIFTAMIQQALALSLVGVSSHIFSY